jgi:Ca2+-binding EF-hand superfamily protein
MSSLDALCDLPPSPSLVTIRPTSLGLGRTSELFLELPELDDDDEAIPSRMKQRIVGRRNSKNAAAPTQVPRPAYVPVFSTQYGGFSYERRKTSVKARYLDHPFLKDSQSTSTTAQSAHVVGRLQQNASQFITAAGDDNRLTFDEFKALVRLRLPTQRPRSDPQLRAWYDVLDVNGDGSVSMSEFFAFSLRETVMHANAESHLENFFSMWTGSDGKLDRAEFTKLAEAVGFGGFADELLASADLDGSGVIEYAEFLAMLRRRTEGGAARAFLMSTFGAPLAPPLLLAQVDVASATGLDFKAQLQEELREALVSNGEEVLQCFERIDVDKDGVLTVVELGRALQHVSLDVPPAAVRELYDEIDQDASGTLTVSELNVWVLRRLDEKERAKQMLAKHLRDNGAALVDRLVARFADADVKVSVRDLTREISSLGYHAPEGAVGCIFDELDTDASGLLSLQELSSWLQSSTNDLYASSHPSARLRDAIQASGGSLMQLFKEWGISLDERIGVDELSLALKELGIEAKLDEVREFLHQRAGDGSGEIFLADLNRYFLNKLRSKATLTQMLRRGLRAHGHRAIDLVAKWDMDGDHLISREEFASAVKGLGFQVPEQVVQKVFDEIDCETDFCLCTSELQGWLDSSDSTEAKPKHVDRRTLQRLSTKSQGELKLANLQRRFPSKTEEEVRKALRSSHGVAGEAALLLDDAPRPLPRESQPAKTLSPSPSSPLKSAKRASALHRPSSSTQSTPPVAKAKTVRSSAYAPCTPQGTTKSRHRSLVSRVGSHADLLL